MKLTLDSNQKKIRQKLLKIINDSHSTWIGSCLSVIDIIDAIYSIKKNNEKFILSNGHAAAALYVILEKYKKIKKANLIDYRVHPDRNPQAGIDLSTGSLGQGLPIALGMAIADQNKNVYCLISDGESAEGSIWEALRVIHDLKITNLKIVVSVNGWGAYDPINSRDLENRFKGFGFNLVKINGHQKNDLVKALKKNNFKPTIIFAKTCSDQLPFLVGQDAHYYTMKAEDYQLAINLLK
jgi:transketolase